MNLTSSLTKEYGDLWKACRIRPNKLGEVGTIVDRIVSGKARYRAAGKPHGVPWHVVGLIHMLEGSGSFSTHLHNGDPLTARTVNDPKRRPSTGHPPFTWEVSASDALVFDGLSTWTNWSLPGTLFVLERFNGFGYRRTAIDIPTPYLWSFSNHYTRGKFIRDNVFSATAVSKQCGAAVLLSNLVSRKLAKIEGAVPVAGAAHPGGST
jgi:lysozyme family protein